MWPVVVGVIGTLLGVLIGGALQQRQASRNRTWQREEALKNSKLNAYSEYLRSISASYGQAVSRQRNRSEDGRLYAAAAQIQVLTDGELSNQARDLVPLVIKAHTMIAAGVSEEKAGVAEVDRCRRKVIELFRADLALKTDPERHRLSRAWVRPRGRRTSHPGGMAVMLSINGDWHAVKSIRPTNGDAVELPIKHGTERRYGSVDFRPRLESCLAAGVPLWVTLEDGTEVLYEPGVAGPFRVAEV